MRSTNERRAPMPEASEQDIVETVDEIVDDIDPLRVDREAERLGIDAVPDLTNRIQAELLARLGHAS
jgi:hypothetical protein